LNCHIHSLLPDGVFSPDEQGGVRFHVLAPPSDEDVAHILERVARRVDQLLARREADDVHADAPTALAEVQAASVQSRLPGLAVDDDDPGRARARGLRCAAIAGFSLHANVHAAAHDRDAVERICRYAGRPPLALARLETTDDGRLAYRLKHIRPGGPTHVVFTPLELLGKLAALVPPPRRHLVRYAGAFAPNSRLRPLVVPPAPADDELPHRHCPAPPTPLPSPPPAPVREPATVLIRRLDWAALLARVFAIDVLRCARCGGRMKVIAFLTDPPVVERILDHLHLPAHPPPTRPGRAPPTDPEFPGWQDETFLDRPPDLG